MRRVGVLMASAPDDSESQARIAAFTQSLQELGWNAARNVQIDTRWATTNVNDLRQHAADLAALGPDVLVAATGTPTVAPLLHATRAVPIVFVLVIDPVGAGFVASLSRPGGNATDGGLIVTASALATRHRDLIITLAARHKLPSVYPSRYFVAAGGLISYGPDSIDQYRRAAGYVDRILKGDRPADMPVQTPTKYQLAINLKTAAALGITIPALLARADEVIE